MKYIGITGTTCETGRKLAWLMAQTLICCMNNRREEFTELFKQLLGDLDRDPDVIGSTDQVTIESFGKYIEDQVRLLHGGFLGVPFDNEHGVEMDTMKIRPVEELDDFNKVTRTTYIKQPRAWMTTLEFMFYYADTVMKGAFGDNIWIKLINTWAERTDSYGLNDEYTIYCDVKTPAELNYIKEDRGGLLLNCTGLSYRDEDTIWQLTKQMIEYDKL